ncbi:putative ribonuclease h protein, partial [Nicotiana attenuata]
VEESVLKQKTQLQWFKDGDANSKYFHSLIRGRRRKLYIHKIKNEDGDWIYGDEAIGEAACDHFQNLFSDPGGTIREDLLSCIPSMITEEDNDNLNKDPTIEELRHIVFSMNPVSAAGPDGLNGKKFQHCWDIIKDDLFNVGRSISENIMLAQEIVQGIKKPNIGANFILSIFKTSTELGPTLFIMGAELLSRMLNNLSHDQFFNGFYMEKRGPQITHLSFADDVIIFTSGCRKSLIKIMRILQEYEQTSGQQINKNKSHFMTDSSVFHYTNRRIHQVTGFTRKDSPITYLGCPLYICRKRIVHFNDLTSKVVSRIRGWHGRLLSYGGRVTLIKHVLQSLPIPLLSAVSPPKTVLRQIEKLAAKSFWGMDKDRNKYHWASWAKLCQPMEEGGIGLRSTEDVCKAMEFKQWWLFRTK